MACRWRRTAISAGVILAICAPAWAESTRRLDPDCASVTATAAPSKAQVAPSKEGAGEPRVTRGLDTLVVPDGGPGSPGFTMVGENVTYADPAFVPYKLREAARRARQTTDISKIP
jgi:hypothetical protein